VEIVDGGAREKSKPNENKTVEPPKDAGNSKYVITAYCPCQKCCGKTDGITASGKKAVQGVTIATDKSIPFGTKIYIDGVGERIVQDRGGAIKGNRIDLYFENHQEALNFGRQTRKVTILN
jgi:3D (Asp-Asp-Asp) domain-containing protein